MALIKAGFEGPFAGGKHEFLVKGECDCFYQIHTKVRSARIYFHEFSSKPISAVKIGKRYNNKINGDPIP